MNSTPPVNALSLDVHLIVEAGVLALIENQVTGTIELANGTVVDAGSVIDAMSYDASIKAEVALQAAVREWVSDAAALEAA